MDMLDRLVSHIGPQKGICIMRVIFSGFFYVFYYC